MRVLALCFVVILLFSGQALALSLSQGGGVNGNKHNLSSKSTRVGGVKATKDTRICVFCHTPHGASAQSSLWNRKDPSTASFPLYNDLVSLHIDDAAIVSTSQYSNADSSIYPNGATRMCLSCHDGVSAVGEVLSSAAQITMTANTLSGSAVVDLATSHPVSFVYNSVVRDYLNTALTATDYQLPVLAAVPLDGLNRMQCTTCHDPHEDTRTTAYSLPFWRNYSGNDVADYDGTCIACHQGSQWGGSWGGSPVPIH